MAACKYTEGSMAKRAITAALVGVLSVGTVPMVALAEGVNDGISLMYAQPGTEYTNGSADLDFYRENGSKAPTSYVKDVETVDAGELPVYASISEVKLAGGSDGIKVTEKNASDYSFRVYRADADGNATGNALAGAKITSAGNYVAVVSALDGDYAGQAFTAHFNVKGQEFPRDIDAYENGNTRDTSFTFTGSALNVGFKSGGKTFTEGVDYTVTYKLKNGKTVDSVVNAGDYVAELTGLGQYAGSTAYESFTVNAFDLSSADVEIADFVGGIPEHPTSVTLGNDALDPSLVTVSPVDDVTKPSTRAYKFEVNPSAEAAGNVTGSNTANAHRLTDTVDFTYDNEALADSYELYAGDGFDLDELAANYSGTEVRIDSIRVHADKYENWDNPSTGGYWDDMIAAHNLSKGKVGEYTVSVKVRVDSADHGQTVYGGEKTFKVKVYKGAIDVDSSVYVYGPDSYKTAITSYSALYDGSDLTKFDFMVKANDKDIVAGRDYTWHLEDANGNEITSATNAGEYKLVTTSEWYKLNGTVELPITISKVDLTSLAIGNIEKWNGVAGEEYIKPNPRVLNFTFDVIKALDLKVGNGDAAQTLPENVALDVEFNDNGIWKPTKSILDLGQYRVVASVSDDVAANYVLPEGETSVTLYFTVAKPGYFTDVQPSAWYYNVVKAAYDQHYMNGTMAPQFDKKGNLVKMGVFSPEGTLTRGQVAAVLFNASGADMDETDAWYSENYGWKTGFSDVDGTQWYGEAIAWCKANGVINGYADGTFQADKPVTREEFVSMLANYAKVVLGDSTVGTVSTDVLADYPDGSSVAGWAASNVAWAASKGIAGNGGTLMPADTMTRAYCAAMMINYLNPELAK